jgi:hypothetical protein
MKKRKGTLANMPLDKQEHEQHRFDFQNEADFIKEFDNPSEQTFAFNKDLLEVTQDELDNSFTPVKEYQNQNFVLLKSVERRERSNSEEKVFPIKLLKEEKLRKEAFKDLLEKQTIRNEVLHEEVENMKLQ